MHLVQCIARGNIGSDLVIDAFGDETEDLLDLLGWAVRVVIQFRKDRNVSFTFFFCDIDQ